MVKCVNCIHLIGIAINSDKSEEKTNSLKCGFYHTKLNLNKTKKERDCEAFEDF
jgi:hypothetical protein